VDNARLYEAEQHARRAAEQAAARMARLQAATAALSEALTPAQVAEVVLYHGITALGARGGGVCLVTEDGSAQDLVCTSGFEERYTAGWSRFDVDMPGPMNDVVRERALVFLESMEDWRERYPLLAPAIAEHGFEAFAGVPLEVEGRVLGSLGYNFTERRTFSEGDAAFLRAMAQQAGQALERSRLYADALAANKAKSDFLAVMSHELRTPLTAILGYAELLGDGIVGPVNETQREQLARIRGSGTHLLTLIEEILSFARLEAGQETVRPETLEAGEVVRDAIAFVEPLMQRKGLRCDLHAPAEPLRLHTDGAKLRQILTNLLANAVKFTERGGVQVEIAREGRGEWARFTVRDSGIGIPLEHMERIFDPFWQVEQSATRRAGGTGLGLSVVRQLAQLLGGEVTVASAPGEGSAFSLTLPVGEGARGFTAAP
jgi:signal transduction histidine kinase